MSSRQLYYKQQPAPVIVYRPEETGDLHVDHVIEQPVQRKSRLGFKEPEVITYRYRLVAIQETGEEMFAGRARTYPEAEELSAMWMQDHPEHRDVRIEHL